MAPLAADGGGVRAAHGSVSIVDTSTRTITQTLRVGRQPFAVAADWKTGRAYVVNSGAFTTAQSGSVSVIAPCRA